MMMTRRQILSEIVVVVLVVFAAAGLFAGLLMWDRSDRERQRRTLGCLAACEAHGAPGYRLDPAGCVCVYP